MQTRSVPECGQPAERQPEVRREIEELCAVQTGLAKSIGELRERLKSVIKDETLLKTETKDPPEKQLCPLAEDIRGIRQELVLRLAEVVDIIRRCEL